MLDASGNVLPVITATRVSYTPEKITTYQRPTADGYTVRCINDYGVPKMSVLRYMPHLDSMSAVTDDVDKVHDILTNLDPELLLWLKDIVTGYFSNLLPKGFGWDGIMTTAEYAKHARISELFIAPQVWNDKDKRWFDNIVVEAVRTSAIYLKLDWDLSFKIMNDYIPIQRFLQHETKVYVVTFDKDGNRTLHLVRRPIYANGKPDDVPEVFKLPKGTVRAILLRTNVMVDEDCSFGVSIDLYKK
jgi:hypothetical protein